MEIIEILNSIDHWAAWSCMSVTKIPVGFWDNISFFPARVPPRQLHPVSLSVCLPAVILCVVRAVSYCQPATIVEENLLASSRRKLLFGWAEHIPSSVLIHSGPIARYPINCSNFKTGQLKPKLLECSIKIKWKKSFQNQVNENFCLKISDKFKSEALGQSSRCSDL